MDSDTLYNQTMIRKLKAAKKLTDSNLIKAFYSVNRAWFMPSRVNDGTYEDIEYRSPSWLYYSDTPIHLFSPSMYVSILKELDFEQGHSFLNVGSGTGYLSCLAGCLIGSAGKNLGIEIESPLVHFAFIQREKVNDFLEENEWASPEILCLNIFDFKTTEKFDRIFVGASVEEHHRTFICRFLKKFGVAVLACNDELQKITNIGDNQFIVQKIQEVDFEEIEILEDDSKMPVKPFPFNRKLKESLESWKKKGKMKNIIWEICQEFDTELFIDDMNGNACFYIFEEEAKINVKFITDKYRMKYASRKFEEEQEKATEMFEKELRKLKENQRTIEEKIEKAMKDKDSQDQEIKDFMEKENMSIADKIILAKEFYSIADDKSFNFAIAGHTKTGKSSLINAFRGIKDDDPAAAKVGITETTNKVEKYEYLIDECCKNITVNLYDIPGSGTLSHDASNYYHEKYLCAFDCLFILVQETVCKEEIEFAKEALFHNQKVAFIHSKCDILLTNKKKQKLISEINQESVDECLQELKRNYVEEIQKSQSSKLQRIPCFYVNSFNLYDLKNNLESEPNVEYQERELLEFMTSEVKYSRNVIT